MESATGTGKTEGSTDRRPLRHALTKIQTDRNEMSLLIGERIWREAAGPAASTCDPNKDTNKPSAKQIYLHFFNNFDAAVLKKNRILAYSDNSD